MLLGKNHTEWPSYHPRRPEEDRLAPTKGTNVADPGNEQFSPEEWEFFCIGSTEEIGRLAVIASSLGPGRLDITKTTFQDGTYIISPRLHPNGISEEDLAIGKVFSSRGDDYPYKDGATALQAMRDEFDIVLKNDKQGGMRNA